MAELASEEREFLTVPSVDAARFSETTTEMRSWGRMARTSVDMRVSRPASVQMAPGAACTALLSNRTRVRYASSDDSAGLLVALRGLAEETALAADAVIGAWAILRIGARRYTERMHPTTIHGRV